LLASDAQFNTYQTTLTQLNFDDLGLVMGQYGILRLTQFAFLVQVKFPVEVPVTVNLGLPSLPLVNPTPDPNALPEENQVNLEASIIYSAITLGTTNALPASAELRVATSVKFPYELGGLVVVLPESGLYNPVTNQYYTACTPNSDCMQNYSVVFQISTTTCDISGSYAFNWIILCRNGSCALNGTVQTAIFQVTSQSLCPSVTIQNALNVESFVAYPLDISIPDPLEFQNTSIGGTFLFGGYQQVLFEATLSTDDVAGISGAHWTTIWIAPVGSYTVPTVTNSQFLILRQDGTNVDLPGTSYSPLSDPIDEPTKLPGSAADPSDSNEFRIRFSLNIDTQLLQDFYSNGGPNLSPYDQALSFSVSGAILVDFVEKRTTTAVLGTTNNLQPTTTLVVDNVASSPQKNSPMVPQQISHKNSISAGIIAVIVVSVVALLVIVSAAVVLFKHKIDSSDRRAFSFKGTEAGL